MAFSGFDRQLLRELRRVHASWNQTYIVQRVLRGISKTSLFSEHVSSVSGMSVDLPRVQAALTSFAESGQPSRGLLRGLCTGAAASVGRHQALGDLQEALADTARSIADQSKPLDQLKTLTRGTATIVAARLPDVRALVDKTIAEAWSSSASADLASDELACLAATADRDPVDLCEDLTRAFRLHGSLDADAFRRLVVPEPVPYQVAAVVHGAAELTRLASLHPTAVSAPVQQASLLGARVGQFVRKVPVEGAACVVVCRVDAVDFRSAGRVARRELSELLDHYMAGHRLVALTLADDVLVSRVDTGAAKHLQSHSPTVRRAVPLVSEWPAVLRNGLRMAHVARTTEAPLPAAALAWAALEACGLTKRDDIAAALSLQAMRQQIVEAYQQLHQGGDRDLLRRVNGHAESDEFVRLRDVNKWVDLLVPPRDTDAPTAADAREALTSLRANAPALAAQQVQDWSFRLTNPTECAHWLEDRRQRMETLLHALNATRNMALHTGQFRAFGDVTLGVGGSLIVDFTLEILGNWYRHATERQPPAQVIAHLARRQRDLVEAMRTHPEPLSDLDIARLTSPRQATPRGSAAPPSPGTRVPRAE